MGHRDAHHEVGPGNRFGREAVALCAHDEGKTGNLWEERITQRDGSVSECHGGRGETIVAQSGERRGYPCPGDEKRRTHRDADRAPIERIAGGRGEQHGIDAQCCRGTENRTDIGRIDHAVNHHHAPGIAKHVVKAGWSGAAHGTEHPTCEGIAREAGQKFAFSGVDREVTATCNDRSGIAGDVPLFAEEGYRSVAGFERHVDDLRAFGDENPLRWVDPIA